jgi:hypothetical protein
MAAKSVCLKPWRRQLLNQVMAALRQRLRWKLKARETRLLAYLFLLVGVAAWKFIPRPWNPAFTVEAQHHIVYSTATRKQTEDTARALESLYVAYSNRFGSLTGFQHTHPRLQVKLFKDRSEFRRSIPDSAGQKPITGNLIAAPISRVKR